MTDSDGDARVERHPAGYAYRVRFPRVSEVLAGELGVVYATDGPEGPAPVVDESALAELLPAADRGDLVTIRLYASPAARDAAARAARTRRAAGVAAWRLTNR